ncbi:MAG: lytic transglycosylase domain-containing protein [Ktedonobacteraceae bacterium]
MQNTTNIQPTGPTHVRKLDKSRLGITLAVGGLVGSMLLSGILGLFSSTSIVSAQATDTSTTMASHAVLTTELALNTNGSSANTSGSLANTAPIPSHPGGSYQDIARQAATYYGISPDLFVRQITQESGFNPSAYSPAGAEGIAQFMPSTAASMGVNPWDPNSALYGGARLMSQLNHEFGGNYAKALAAYNAGSGAVHYAIREGGSNWYNYLPAESQNYVTVIMG